MSIIDSLKVEGNIPCPTPATISKQSHPRRKSSQLYENPSARPVRIKLNTAERHINSEEDIKNILMQAKAPALNGPTIIAKRMGFMSKIKQLNDGMYKHHTVGEDMEQPKTNILTLEGRKVDSNHNQIPESHDYSNDEQEKVECEVVEDSKQEILPHRSAKSSLNSAKSYHSVRSAKSDPGVTKPIALPSLTIGADRHKTKGEYITASREDVDVYGLSVGKDMYRGEHDEYEFRFQTPRKFRLRGETRELRSPDSTGNYGSLSLRDLKACLHVNHSNNNEKSSTHQDYIVQNYIKQIKTQKRSGFKVNPYKMLKASPRSRMQSRVSPRYEFNSVESYLKFNKPKSNAQNHVISSGQSLQNKSHADTVVLQMISDLNSPSTQRHASVNSWRLTAKDQTELLQIKPPMSEKIDKSNEAVVDGVSTSGTKQEKAIIQHIVYVPSGQASKVRLVKS